MKYIRNFSAHTDYEAEMSKIPTPSVSYCRKENECHFMPNNVIMFKVGDLNGNTNQTVTVNYYEGGSETIPITEGNKWYVHEIPSGKSLNKFVGIKEITDTIISAKIKIYFGAIINNIRGNLTFIACDTSDITNMWYMFNNAGNITSLDVSILDTSNVTDMSYMFQSCRGLQTLDVSNWDVSKVTTMNRMFNGCASLQSLDLSNWNVANVTSMEVMFGNCSSFQTLNLSGWNTSKVTNMFAMFSRCSSFQTLNLSGWNTSKVTNMNIMFQLCEKLQSLDLSNWNVANVTTMSDMFKYCDSLKTIIMKGCNQTTIDKIKAQLETDGILNNVTIITE